MTNKQTKEVGFKCVRRMLYAAGLVTVFFLISCFYATKGPMVEDAQAACMPTFEVKGTVTVCGSAYSGSTCSATGVGVCTIGSFGTLEGRCPIGYYSIQKPTGNTCIVGANMTVSELMLLCMSVGGY